MIWCNLLVQRWRIAVLVNVEVNRAGNIRSESERVRSICLTQGLTPIRLRLLMSWKLLITLDGKLLSCDIDRIMCVFYVIFFLRWVKSCRFLFSSEISQWCNFRISRRSIFFTYTDTACLIKDMEFWILLFNISFKRDRYISFCHIFCPLEEERAKGDKSL